jgi:hypothetical protein
LQTSHSSIPARPDVDDREALLDALEDELRHLLVKTHVLDSGHAFGHVAPSRGAPPARPGPAPTAGRTVSLGHWEYSVRGTFYGGAPQVQDPPGRVQGGTGKG